MLSTPLRPGTFSVGDPAYAPRVPLRRVALSLGGVPDTKTRKTEQPRLRPELQGGNLVPMSRLQRGTGTIDPVFIVQAEVKVPVYRSLANRQLDSSAIFQFGFSRAF